VEADGLSTQRSKKRSSNRRGRQSAVYLVSIFPTAIEDLRMQIRADADACPGKTKELLFRAVGLHGQGPAGVREPA
jgi:hypothetical protein